MKHDFDKSLAHAQANAEEAWWEQVYRTAFPGFATMMNVHKDGWAQRGGIDRVILLESGKVLFIDEKVRWKAWPDILLEYEHVSASDEERRWPGWVAKDLACDFVAYAFVAARRCYLLPFVPLRRAWIENSARWLAELPHVRAQNQGYVTHSVAVPTEVLFKALQGALRVVWEEP
jgi:hypothetical protein